MPDDRIRSAYNWVWVEGTARAALTRANALWVRANEGAFSAWKRRLVAAGGLSRQVDEGLGVAMEHEESTGSGGRGVGPGRVMGGSWIARRERREVCQKEWMLEETEMSAGA
jgi:hypothetical protein